MSARWWQSTGRCFLTWNIYVSNRIIWQICNPNVKCFHLNYISSLLIHFKNIYPWPPFPGFTWLLSWPGPGSVTRSWLGPGLGLESVPQLGPGSTHNAGDWPGPRSFHIIRSAKHVWVGVDVIVNESLILLKINTNMKNTDIKNANNFA